MWPQWVAWTCWGDTISQSCQLVHYLVYICLPVRTSAPPHLSLLLSLALSRSLSLSLPSTTTTTGSGVTLLVGGWDITHTLLQGFIAAVLPFVAPYVIIISPSGCFVRVCVHRCAWGWIYPRDRCVPRLRFILVFIPGVYIPWTHNSAAYAVDIYPSFCLHTCLPARLYVCVCMSVTLLFLLSKVFQGNWIIIHTIEIQTLVFLRRPRLHLEALCTLCPLLAVQTTLIPAFSKCLC